MSEAFKLAPHEWALLRGLLDEALALPLAQRAAWLDQLDETRARGLKPRLRSLLANAGNDDDPATAARLLQTLPKVETGQFAPLPGSVIEKPGDAIGPYRLIRELGSGGMGSVWLAERTDMLQGRQVALKLPHGAWKRAGLAERLAREREILATLEHPHIARLYDAGLAADGQPWLALEYVQGERIDVHCRSKDLPVPARLRLFLQVAQAVAHAHAQLVVHRDLKPANILVTEAGDVKLLDFGIAKLVQEGVVEETELTRDVGRVLTPEYASPEQILGKPIGTASDVYSLGVVLFELLAGERPYRLQGLQRSSRAALEEAIVAADVPRPSALAPTARRQALRGDLDTIVLKALKRDPAERYATVAALADDVQRHLEQRPVLALPDSAWYRATKFLRRNRLAVGATGAVAVALVAGTAIAVWQARRAVAEQQRAEQVAAFIGAVFQEANPFQQGSGKPLTGAELLRLAKDRLVAAPPADAATRVDLLTLLGTSLFALEDLPTAAGVLQQAVRDAEAAFGAADTRTLRARLRQSDVLRLQDKNDEARKILETLLPRLREQRAAQPSDLVSALRALADVEFRTGKGEAADPYFEEGLDVVRRHLGEDHADHLALLSLKARNLRTRSRTAQALQTSQEAMRIAQTVYAGTPRHPVLSEARFTHGFILADNGRYAEAVQSFRTALAETEALFGRASRRHGTRLGSSSEIFALAGLLREGIANAELSRATLLTHAPARSRLDGASAEVVALAHNLARDGERAVPLWRHAESVYRELMGEASWVVQVTRRNLSLALTWSGELAEAERVMNDVLAGHPRPARDGYDTNAWIAGIRERLAGRAQAALALQQRALDSMPGTASDVLPRAYALTERGLAELALGRRTEARASLAEALRHFETSGIGIVAERADALLGLGRLELAEGRHAAALPHLQRAETFWRELRAESLWAAEATHWLAQGLAAAGRGEESAKAAARVRPLLARSPFPPHRELVAGR
ncbi:MAG: serine/threonine protein kinase [Rubrivivax sp.]|nr:serine/threonine protein kinase [Rubrivivax sp.]